MMTPTLSAAQLVREGAQAARRGDKELARQLLLQVTAQDPNNEEAWLWLAGVAESPQEAQVCLQTVLAINPANMQARQGLGWLQGQLPARASDWDCPMCSSHVPAAQPICPLCGYTQVSEASQGAQPILATRPSQTPAVTIDLPGYASASEWGQLPKGFVLSVEQAEAVDICLERIAYESEAKCIILADITGQLISERGEVDRMNTQVLSALAAGELAATHEMARLVGEPARFRLLLHEGEKHSVYLSDVGEQMILVIVFDVGTPIGLVRMILKQAVEELRCLLQDSEADPVTPISETLGGDFAQLLEAELDTRLEA